VLGTSLLWRSTVAYTYLKVKYAKCLCLLPVVLVLSFWSCKQWSWSCYFGLGLKNLVLFISLVKTFISTEISGIRIEGKRKKGNGRKGNGKMKHIFSRKKGKRKIGKLFFFCIMLNVPEASSI